VYPKVQHRLQLRFRAGSVFTGNKINETGLTVYTQRTSVWFVVSPIIFQRSQSLWDRGGAGTCEEFVSRLRYPESLGDETARAI